MTSPEFQPWPKIARLNRDIVITEKLDGTNSAIQIVPGQTADSQDGWVAGVLDKNGNFWKVAAQSRNRLIDLGKDNFGFARWVNENAEALVEILGEGVHFGEWWGSGIQRGYGLTNGEKRFSLFNTHRWKDCDFSGVKGLGVVPVLYQGMYHQRHIDDSMRVLRMFGSEAARGFAKPEGIVIYHTAAREMFKVTLENDEKPKGSNE